MSSAAANADQELGTTRESRYGWLKAHLGSLAIAFAIIFGAGVWGFVSSPPFATFFMGFILFLALFASFLLFAVDGNITSALISYGFLIVSLIVLFNVVGESMSQLEKAEAARIAAAAPAQS